MENLSRMSEISEIITVELYITEPEDLPLIEINLEGLGMGTIMSTRQCEKVPQHTYVTIMVESMDQLYLLGRFVGCDRKGIFNKDF